MTSGYSLCQISAAIARSGATKQHLHDLLSKSRAVQVSPREIGDCHAAFGGSQ